MASQLLQRLGLWLALPPGNPAPGLFLLAAFLVCCELTRILLGTELTRSRLAHLAICLLTFAVQSLVLAAVLVHADRAHPGRGWVNLGYAAALYLIWYLAGELTRLVRPDGEGADVGFMSVGAVITFSAGLVAALLT
jgi:hypothetical protein